MKNKGQIAIITLFSLAVFVVIGGSIVTQIIFEQRKAVLEEKSRQAYYAAESGIENALQEIYAEGAITEDSLTIGNAIVGITSNVEEGESTASAPSDLSSGEHFYLNLDGYLGSGLTICWDKSDTGIVATYFYEDASILKSNTYSFNSGDSGTPITNADNSTLSSNLCGITGPVYYVALTGLSGIPKYLLIWVAYEDNVQVAFQAEASQTFPAQYTIVTSTAQVSENSDQVTRELEYSVSRVGDTSLTYPPAWLTVPIFAQEGVTYADE